MKKFTFTILFQIFICFSIPLQAQWINTNLPWNRILSLAIKGDTLFAGTDGSGFFRSSDNGVTWDNVNNGLHPGAKNSIAVSGNNIFVGTYGGGIWLSTDNGTSWNPVNSGLTNLLVYSIAVSGNHIFAATWGGGVFLSTNSGTSWTPVNIGLTDLFIRSLAFDGNKVFAGTLNNGVFLSLNNGTSWVPVNNGFPAETTPNTITIIGNKTYVGTSSKGIYISSDTGITWSSMNNGLYDFSPNFPYPVYSIANVANKLFTGTMNGVFLYQNNLSWWNAVNSGFPSNITINAMTIMCDYLFAGTDNGIWRRPLLEMPLVEPLPPVVDNINWFPPVRSQQVLANCTHFSLIYYLKSYQWNRYYNRDPLLEENQFNHNFVWNQNCGPLSHCSGTEFAFEMLSRQGCTTVDEFPINEQDQDVFPGVEVKRNALLYKSSKLEQVYINPSDSIVVQNQLNILKDSLRNGHCFTLSVEIYDSFFNLTDTNNVYNCSCGNSLETGGVGHAITITGYNDTIPTSQGQGAFKVINSNAEIAGGIFYYDYNWFFYRAHVCYFLQEKFNYQPRLSINFDIDSMVTGNEIALRHNCFTDTAFTKNGSRFDYLSAIEYFQYPRFLQLKKINGQIVPSTIIPSNYSNDVIILPQHDHFGNRQIVADLTGYINADSLQSLEMIFYDPISATYTGENDSTVYSYTRQANAEINESYIQLLLSYKRIAGQVIDLPDTTIVTNNFNSYPAGFHMTPPVDAVPIKQCVSVLKRKRITFSIEDTITFNSLPTVFTSNVSLITKNNAASGGNAKYDGGLMVTARGVCWSTTQSPTVSDDHTTDGTGIGTFSSTITGLAPATTYHVRAYATNTVGTAYGKELTFTTINPCLGMETITIHHVVSRGVAPVDKTVTYGTIADLPEEPSKCWITSNLGASRQAASVIDATEASAGWYWQFNRKQGYKHSGTLLTPSWTIFSITESSDWTADNDPCSIELGCGWRIPTNTEWLNVDLSENWTNWDGPWNSGLKLHAAGYISPTGGNSIGDRGNTGWYWSSTQNDFHNGWYLYFQNGFCNINNNSKAVGAPLRCLKETDIAPLPPTVSTTAISNIGQNTAISGGNVTCEGETSVTARGVCWSTLQNPTISDNLTTDGTGTGIFTSALTGLAPVTTYYIRAYATNSIGTAYGNEIIFSTINPCPGSETITVNHVVSGGVAPVDKTVIYGTVAGLPGEPAKCWITSNLGADHQATSVSDATEASAGWYWQFDQKQGYKHDGTTRTPNTSWITTISTNTDWQAANDPCALELGSVWRIPTLTEWNNVDGIGNWNDWNGPWNSGLKLHAAGYLMDYDGSLQFQGYFGNYRSSTSWFLLGFSPSNCATIGMSNTLGSSLRCIREASTTPITTTISGTVTETSCYDATQAITVAGNGTTFIVQSAGSATMIAGQNIKYLPTTIVHSGGYLWGYIAPNGPFCGTMAPSIITAPIAVEEISNSSDRPFFKVYPNPTIGTFILELTGDISVENITIDVYGIWGEKILTKTMNGEGKHEISLSGKPSGVYFIRVISGDKAETVKIIKQ